MTFWKQRSISVKLKTLKVPPSFPCEAYFVANYSEFLNAFGFIWFMLAQQCRGMTIRLIILHWILLYQHTSHEKKPQGSGVFHPAGLTVSMFEMVGWMVWWLTRNPEHQRIPPLAQKYHSRSNTQSQQLHEFLVIVVV